MSIEHFDRIYLINLAHRKDRRALAESMLKEYGLLSKVIYIEATHDLLNGHRGCCLSHLKALYQAKLNKHAFPLILEDDALFTLPKKELEGELSYFFDVFKEPFDVYLLGGNVFECKSTKDPKIKQVLCAQTAHAYVPSFAYLDRLIACFETSYENMKLDELFDDSTEKAIDQEWKKLQRVDRWYIGKILAQQRRSYSDILHKVRDRSHHDVV